MRKCRLREGRRYGARGGGVQSLGAAARSPPYAHHMCLGGLSDPAAAR